MAYENIQRNAPKRILIQRHNDGIAAIDCDSKSQVVVEDFNESHRFVVDLIGLNDQAAARYTTGFPVSVGMAVGDWDAWIEHYQTDDSAFVWLSLWKAGDKEDCISALCLTDSREAIAPPDEKSSMIADLIGFNAGSFEGDFNVVARMKTEHWAAWLELFEVAPLDDETVAMLCDDD